jgi:hypothetical protein
VGSLITRYWNKVPQTYKGVKPGGEEFISKLEKELKNK